MFVRRLKQNKKVRHEAHSSTYPHSHPHLSLLLDGRRHIAECWVDPDTRKPFLVCCEGQRMETKVGLTPALCVVVLSKLREIKEQAR